MRRRILFSMIMFLALGLIVGIAHAKDLKAGLVGYWPLDGNGDDKAGKSTGKLDGGANWTKTGRVNGAVELDGKTGCVVISGFTLTTTELTAVMWFIGVKYLSIVT